MKNEKFIKNWKKARRDGRTVYIVKFSIAALLGILIGGFLVSIFFPLDEVFLVYSLVLFATSSVSLDYKWDKNEKRYEEIIAKNQDL